MSNLLLYVARPRNAPGVDIAAVHIDQPRRPVWQTRVGVPAAWVAADDGSSAITLITAAGSPGRRFIQSKRSGTTISSKTSATM
jgi:hypothetical protein